MSVLIKGMKIPQSCYMCDMQELSGAVGCKHAYDVRNSEWGRRLNCPLIEISDHGDLIDADRFFDEFCELCDYEFEARNYVVIPAERSEESICDNCDERSDVGCSWCKRFERSEDETD